MLRPVPRQPPSEAGLGVPLAGIGNIGSDSLCPIFSLCPDLTGEFSRAE